MKMVRLLVALSIALFAGSVLAQYPNRPLRLVVPFPPGGAVDVLGRAIALNAREIFGQNIIVDNRAGFGGLSATRRRNSPRS